MKITGLILLFFPIVIFGQVTIGPSSGRDITTALQTALNSGKNVHIANGEYTINATITVPANVSVTGDEHTVIAADASSGTLFTLMRFFQVYGNNSAISRITLTGDKFGLDKYSLSAIYVTGAHNRIDSNIFKFSFHYGQDVYGVWISGPDANYNKVTYNKCYTVGIQYAENAASHSLCEGNYIYKAGTDGLQGTGNNAGHIFCKGNRVIHNVVDKSGYMGIEDQQYIDSTLIADNRFTNSGQAKVYLSSMGISSIGVNTIVKNNFVKGFGIYGIEIAGGCNLRIENNTVTDSTYKGSLCMVNMLFVPRYTYAGATHITNNKLTGGNIAIDLEGDYNVKLQVEDNKIKNPAWKGIYLETKATDTKVIFKNNELLFSNPNIKERIAINTYAKSPTTNTIIIEGNKITYLGGTAKGKGVEIGILPGHSGTVVKDNIVKTFFPGVYSFATNGNVVNAVHYINNTNAGGKVDLKSFTNKVEKGNNW